jgi:iron(III) transport system permease protein
MRLISLLRLLVIVLLAMPVLMVLAAWLQWNEASADVLLGMASTVLPSYVVSSLGLCFWVAIGVISMGSVSAAAVTLFDFKGRRTLEWALLLPLAMPAYVVAYAYSDFLQFSGPLQTALRAAFGWQGALWPDVRRFFEQMNIQKS